MWAELGTLAFLVFNLLGKNRNIMLLFAYVHLLKMRYHFGDKVALHRMVSATGVCWHTAKRRFRAFILLRRVCHCMAAALGAVQTSYIGS